MLLYVWARRQKIIDVPAEDRGSQEVGMLAKLVVSLYGSPKTLLFGQACPRNEMKLVGYRGSPFAFRAWFHRESLDVEVIYLFTWTMRARPATRQSACTVTTFQLLVLFLQLFRAGADPQTIHLDCDSFCSPRTSRMTTGA